MGSRAGQAYGAWQTRVALNKAEVLRRFSHVRRITWPFGGPYLSGAVFGSGFLFTRAGSIRCLVGSWFIGRVYEEGAACVVEGTFVPPIHVLVAELGLVLASILSGGGSLQTTTVLALVALESLCRVMLLAPSDRSFIVDHVGKALNIPYVGQGPVPRLPSKRSAAERGSGGG